MESESPLPAKRLRTTLNGNLQLTECVREFKLPRQFPSMVTKVNSDGINDKNKVRPHFNTSAVTCLSKTPINTKIVTNLEIPASTFTRKIKLKGKDGKDLGVLNVKDLPQNIQGKTITLAKNGIIRPPEIVSPSDKSKGITIGVLTPVNIVKPEKTFIKSISSVPFVNKNNKEIAKIERDIKKPIIVNQSQLNNGQKAVIVEQTQMSAVMDSQGRPQLIVFQSGKNWHTLKLATTAPPNIIENKKNIVLEKLTSVPNCGKATILQAKEQNRNFSTEESSKNGADKLLASGKTFGTNHSNTIIVNTADRCKSKSPIAVTENGESRPKIEISRVFVPANNKSASQIQTASKLPLENTKSTTSTGQSSRNNTSLQKDVMVVLPNDIPESLNSDSELSSEINMVEPTNSNINDSSTLKYGKNSTVGEYPATRDLFSTRKETKKPEEDEEQNNESLDRFDILSKALCAVEDKELRAKALKALADCRIGMERLVPISPPSEKKLVKNSDTQTPVFGIIEPEHFIYVTKENPGVERIRPIVRKAPQKIGHIIGNPQIQELSLNGFDLPNWVTPNACSDLDAMVTEFVGENEGVNEVKNILANKPNPISSKLVSQLEEDFQTYKTFDENGLLNIHRAVIDDDLPAVSRLLSLFRRENPDARTVDGQTSLELAIRYEVSPKIVKMLLDAGAEPTSSEMGHDSALIIASRKSLPILKELIPYVSTRQSLDNYDSSGFAALHYCAQNNNRSGAIDLANALADINVRDRRSGRTPLFHAVENENIELAQFLLDKGAQANIASYSGHTVFALVEEGKHYSLAESLNRIAK